MNPHYREIDYTFMHETEDEQALRLDNHEKALQNARRDLIQSKFAFIKERERLESLAARGIRHKNKLYKFNDRMESARNHLMELEDNPLTLMLKGRTHESVSAIS